MPAPVGGGDLDLFVRQRRDIEELGDTLAPFDFHQKHPTPAGRQGQRQRGRHGGLAGATLAGDEMQPSLGQPGRPADCAGITRFGRHHAHAIQAATAAGPSGGAG